MADPLTFEEHRELAREILKTRAQMLHLGSAVISVYGPQSRTSFAFMKANEAIDRLCVELETQAESDCPGLDASSFYR